MLKQLVDRFNQSQKDIQVNLENQNDYETLSAKFTAALQHAQAGDQPILTRIEVSTGHGLGKPTALVAAEWADLLAFGVEPSGLPLCLERPRPRTRAEAFGVLYVVEGATLGGQVLSRHLEETLGLGSANGARFFHGYGSRTGAMWQAFRKALLACPFARGEEDAMVRAAIDTFRALREWCGERE